MNFGKKMKLTVDHSADFRSLPGGEKRKFLIYSMQIKKKTQKKNVYFSNANYTFKFSITEI